MTISPPMAASQASEYYRNGSGSELLESIAADEIKKSNFQVAKSGWSGEIAEKFDLKGEVDQADFEKVLAGVNPIDEQPLVRHRRAARPKIVGKTKEQTDDEIIAESAEKTEIVKTEIVKTGATRTETAQVEIRANKTTDSVAIMTRAATAQVEIPQIKIPQVETAEIETAQVEIAQVEIPQVEIAQVEKTRIKNAKPAAPSTQSKKGKTSEHRACWDVTFSAPKSVSLAAIVGGDLRLIEVHRQAVATALREVEQAAEARLGGTKPPEKTGKLLMASFEHYVARPDKKENFAAADLHTHNPVLNFTFAENGKSYAIQPQKLFAAQKLGTAVYRLELAKGMTDLGYEIRFDETTKAPEIAAISREYIKAVSPRQAEIKAKAKELNINSTRQIVVRHRSAKTERSADNLEFHRQIEKSFDGQASAAVEKSLVNTKIFQPVIVEQLQAEVTLQRTKIFEKAEQRRNYYAAQQLKNQNNEQTGTERETRTIETEVGNIVIEPGVGVIIEPDFGNEYKRTEDRALAVVPASRNTTITAGRQLANSNSEHRTDTDESQSSTESRSDAGIRDNTHQSDIKLGDIELGHIEFRDEIENRSGSRQTFGGTKRDLLAESESSGGAIQDSGKQDRGNGLESATSLGRDENLGIENDFEPQIGIGEAGESAKSTSSEGSARSGTNEAETITRIIADQAVSAASQAVGTAKPIHQSLADEQPDGIDLDDLLRAAENERQLAVSRGGLPPEDIRTEKSAAVSRVESAGDFTGELPEIIAAVEVRVESRQVVSDDFNHGGLSGDILTADSGDSDVLASDRRDDGSDFGNDRDHFDIHLSDVQPRTGTGIRSDDFRTGDHLWGDLLPVESELDGRIVRSGGVEFFDAVPAVNQVSDSSSFPQFADPISSASDYYSSSFDEIEQIFAAQNRQETLAAEIVSAANQQRLQNQQTEINQAVQDKMFAYLMQLSENSAPITAAAAPDDVNNNPTALETVHQNFLTNEENLERFAQSVEEHHFSEEQAARTAAENSARINKLADRNIFDEEEEPEEYEDHPDFEEERGFSLSM